MEAIIIALAIGVVGGAVALWFYKKHVSKAVDKVTAVVDEVKTDIKA